MKLNVISLLAFFLLFTISFSMVHGLNKTTTYTLRVSPGDSQTYNHFSSQGVLETSSTDVETPEPTNESTAYKAEFFGDDFNENEGEYSYAQVFKIYSKTDTTNDFEYLGDDFFVLNLEEYLVPSIISNLRGFHVFILPQELTTESFFSMQNQDVYEYLNSHGLHLTDIKGKKIVYSETRLSDYLINNLIVTTPEHNITEQVHDAFDSVPTSLWFIVDVYQENSEFIGIRYKFGVDTISNEELETKLRETNVLDRLSIPRIMSYGIIFHATTGWVQEALFYKEFSTITKIEFLVSYHRYYLLMDGADSFFAKGSTPINVKKVLDSSLVYTLLIPSLLVMVFLKRKHH